MERGELDARQTAQCYAFDTMTISALSGSIERGNFTMPAKTPYRRTRLTRIFLARSRPSALKAANLSLPNFFRPRYAAKALGSRAPRAAKTRSSFLNFLPSPILAMF